MEASQMLTQIKTLLDTTKEILLVTRKDPTADSIGSLLAAYLGLRDLGKTVTILCPTPMTVEMSNFIGADKVKLENGKRNFIISLDYQEGSIEKVSYNIEGEKFNLVIEPRVGFETFSEKNVSYSHAGGTYDCIITVDTANLGLLDGVYSKEKDLFATKPVINIDSHHENANYGKYNVVDPNASSTAEVVAVVLSSLGVQLSEDIAANLLNAVYDATDNFQKPRVNARTFEVASVCMKAGGKRFGQTKGQDVVVAKQETKKTDDIPVKQPPVTNPPPEDWLKPKIYKSTNIS